MSRSSRVSYFQNVFDLLDYEPPVSPAALAAIEETEGRIGRRLPAALRDWYSREGVVEIGPPVGHWQTSESQPWFPLPGPIVHLPASWTQYLWYNFVGNSESSYSTPDSLTAVLAQIDGRVSLKGAEARFVRFLVESYDQSGWVIERTGPDDPPVWRCDGQPDPAAWARVADHFSWFVFVTIAHGYRCDTTPIACHPEDLYIDKPPTLPPAPPKPYVNALWLRAPEEPFSAPVIRCLIDRLGEPERIERTAAVTTHTFHPEGGTVRVTADTPTHAGPLSAWWVHAETADRLEDLARRLLPLGTLSQTLTAEGKSSKAVLERAKGKCRCS